jgi:hypothetical protein
MKLIIRNKVSLELTQFKANCDNLKQTVMGSTGTKNARYSYISLKDHIIAAPEQQLNY